MEFLIQTHLCQKLSKMFMLKIKQNIQFFRIRRLKFPYKNVSFERLQQVFVVSMLQNRIPNSDAFLTKIIFNILKAA